MAQVSKTTSKSKFETGDVPTQSDFVDLHDSAVFHDSVNTVGLPITGLSSDPATTANAATIFAKLFNGRTMIGQVGADGHPYLYQPFMGLGRVTAVMWGFNSASASNIGGGANTAEGTASAISMGSQQAGESTCIYTMRPRARVTSTAAANNPAGYRSTGPVVALGSTAGEGGFFSVFQCGIATPQTGHRGFVGFRNINDIPNSSAATAWTDCICFGFDNQTTWRVLSNDASGNTTEHVDLGSNFPTNTSSDGWLTFAFYAPPNQTSIVYYYARRITNAGTVYETSGSITSNLPAARTLMNWHMWINTGTSSSAVVFDVGCVYIETEN